MEAHAHNTERPINPGLLDVVVAGVADVAGVAAVQNN
jgi:hypothetical protein